MDGYGWIHGWVTSFKLDSLHATQGLIVAGFCSRQRHGRARGCAIIPNSALLVTCHMFHDIYGNTISALSRTSCTAGAFFQQLPHGAP